MESQQSAFSNHLNLSVDEDAQNYAPEGELSSNIYRLLLKNVSRDDPLTREEAQELREFKLTLTEEQWKHWLHFAREEKHALKREARRNSPPKLRDLAKSPSKLLKVLATAGVKELVENGHEEDNAVSAPAAVPSIEPSQARRHEVSWSDSVGANLGSNSEPEAEASWVQDAHSQHALAAARLDAPPPAEASVPSQHAARAAAPPPAEPILQAPAYAAAEEFAHRRELRHEDRQSHQPKHHHARSNEQPPNQRQPQYQSQPQHNQVQSVPQCPPQHQSQYQPQYQPQFVSQYQHHADSAGVSLERNSVVGRAGPRARSASAPRDRPSGPPQGAASWASADWGQVRTTPGPAYAQQHHHRSNPVSAHSPKQRDVESPFRGGRQTHQHPNHHQHHRKQEHWYPDMHSFDPSASLGYGPSARSGAHASRSAPPSRATAQYATRQPAPAVPVTLDLAEAAEIARSTAFRLDSAYSAAQCLLSSMAADQAEADSYASSHAQPPQRAQATISILAEMMSSMDKSRAALSQLSDLHSQQQKQQQPARSHSSSKERPAARSPADTFEDADAWQDGEEEEKGAWEAVFDEAPPARHAPASVQRAQHRQQDRPKPRSSTAPARADREDFGQDTEDTSFLSAPDRRPSEWNIPDEEEPPSMFMSPGASLNARYAQNKAPGEFSPWNKQLATSALAGSGAHIDPVSNLQGQLFDAADTARRAANQQNVTRSTAQSPAKHASQYSYSSAGYVWEGVRYNRAQGPVSRVCLSHGPLVKAFDDYPVRVDAETGAVDVVWREARVDAAASAWGTMDRLGSRVQARGKLNSSSGQLFDGGAARSSVLRRERFAFDDIFTGQTADGRLAMYSRQRARKALEGARSLAFLCLGCGDVPSAGESAVEPPVSTLLGGGGGTGLISSVIDEIFRFTRPLTASMQDSGKAFSGSFPTAAQSPFVASKVAFEQLKSKVTLSAIILSDRGDVFDLLSTAGAVQPSANGGGAGASLKRRKSDGRVVLCSASRLQLQNASDFDRVMGLLLGKRTALQGVLSTMQHQRAQQRAAGLAVSDESMQEILASIDPWAAFNSKSADRAVEGSTCASTMLITVSVTGGLASSGQTTADFYFISPCGKNWFNPGADINILAELVAGLPTAPPPSLLRASPLGLLLMDPRNPATDFVNIVTINRESSAAAKDPDSSAGGALVQGALNSLRIIAQLTQ